MILIDKSSRRRFIFELDTPENFDIDGVKCTDGICVFYASHYFRNGHWTNAGNRKEGRKLFKDERDCREWYEKFKVNKMEKELKKEVNLRTKSLKDISEGVWAKMKSFMVNPDRWEQGDFRTYEDHLVGNMPDRDNERFPVSVLKSFMKSLPGKSKTIAHQWSQPGQGVYYDARLAKMSIEEALKFVGMVPDKKYQKKLEKVIEIDGAIYVLVGDFYIRADKTELIDDIDDGSASKSSVGFRAGRPFELMDDKDNLLWMEYPDTDKDEAVEGSIVGVQAQYGMRITKDFDPLSDEDIAKSLDAEIIEDTKPYENEHACRLLDPEQFSRFARKNCAQKSDGKCIDVIYGISEGKSKIQALRYKKDIWSKSTASKHCKSRGGTFEAAKGLENPVVMKYVM